MSALEVSKIVEKTLEEKLKLTFEYQYMNKVMRIIKQKRLLIFSQEMTEDCELILSIKKSEIEYAKGISPAVLGSISAPLL